MNLEKIKERFKSHCEKEYWIVTCIDEELDIIEQGIFNTYTDAKEYMDGECTKTLDLINSVAIDIVESCIFKMSATIVYGEQPEQLEWKITCVTK